MMKSGLLITLTVIFQFTVCVKDGTFYLGRHNGGYVIKVVDKKGPQQCLRFCSRYRQCNAINYSKNNLLCELLKITSSWQPLQETDGYVFSSLASWTMDQNSCWPNPCDENEKCIILHDSSHLCLLADIPCKNQVCMYGGTCNNVLNAFSCDCPTGYSGRHCQITPCTVEPCQNSGTCVLSVGSYTCTCPFGYHGTNCETYVCGSNPCYNDGTCIPNGSTTYSCECALGYSGLQCNTHVCGNNPCNNGGTCIPTGSTTYSCECTLGYSGLQCNTYVCANSPCYNEGTCIPNGSTTYSCECATGYSGLQCNTYVCGNNPCQNDGTCTPIGNTAFSCECTSGYTGEQCNDGSCGPPRSCAYDEGQTCQCDSSCHLPKYNDCCNDKPDYCPS